MSKKLISIRVESEKYDKIRQILDRKNAGRPSWRRVTFTDIVDKAMTKIIESYEE